MIKFPYKKELSEAYRITIKNPWLWVFGLFIGGATGNFSEDGNFYRAGQVDIVEESKIAVSESLVWISAHLLEFIGIVLLVAGVLLLIVLLQGLSRGAILWSAVEFTKNEEQRSKGGVRFRKALKASLKYIYKIVGLQLLLVFTSAVILIAVVSPIVFLFSVGATAKAGILILLALSLFLPVIAVLFFSFILGPIFVVMYKQTVVKSLTLSLKLIKKRFWHMLGVTVVLLFVGIVIGVIASALFAVVSAIGVGMSLLVVQDATQIASKLLFFGSILIASICVIVLGSAYASFSQIFWLIIVKKMFGELEIDEKEEAVAVESVI